MTPAEIEAMVKEHFSTSDKLMSFYHIDQARRLAAALTAAHAAEVERLRAVLERISALGKKRAPVLDEDADYDDCVDYGKAMGAFTAAAIARAALAALEGE